MADTAEMRRLMLHAADMLAKQYHSVREAFRDQHAHGACQSATYTHLGLAPGVVNSSRAGWTTRTGRCRKGHEVRDPNVYIIRGLPACRTCHLDRQNRYERRQAASKAHRAHKDEVRQHLAPKAAP